MNRQDKNDQNYTIIRFASEAGVSAQLLLVSF